MVDETDLHDAILLGIHMLWDDGTCTLSIRHGTLGNLVMIFSAVSCLTLPREQKWGRSASIHSFTCAGDGEYEIDMQSGDLIRLRAAGVVLRQAGQDGS